jgi:membrane-bound ClpP family serine protease
VSQRVVALQIDGEIDPVMAEHIDGGIDQANRAGAALI